MSKVTGSDIAMLEYFAIERADVTKWIAWKWRKESINNEYPDIIEALRVIHVLEGRLTVQREVLSAILEHAAREVPA